MTGLRGVFAGALALTTLQAVVSSSRATGRVGQLATATAGIVRAVLDPTVPAIPDLRERARARGTAAAAQPATLHVNPAIHREAAPVAAVPAGTFHRAQVPNPPGIQA